MAGMLRHLNVLSLLLVSLGPVFAQNCPNLAQLDNNTIDDRDPNIRFSAGWTQKSVNGTGDFFAGTQTGTVIGGANATLSFVGTQVFVLGSADAGSLSSYVVDNRPPVVLSGTPAEAASAGPILLFASPNLADQTHTLVVTNLFGGGDKPIGISIDSLIVSSGSGTPPTLPPAVTGSLTSTATTANPTSTETTATASGLTQAEERAPPAVAEVVGIVFGVVGAGILILILIRVWYRRESKRLGVDSRDPEAAHIMPLAADRSFVGRSASIGGATSRSRTEPQMLSMTSTVMDPGPSRQRTTDTRQPPPPSSTGTSAA